MTYSDYIWYGIAGAALVALHLIVAFIILGFVAALILQPPFLLFMAALVALGALCQRGGW